MSKLVLGILCGLAFGLVAVATMIPLKFEDKTRAMLGAFLNRFAVGLVIAVADLPGPGWLRGLGIAVLLSLPDAIITRSFVPIMGLGAVGGIIIGLIAG